MMVFPAYRLLLLMRPRRAGVSRSMVASRSLEKDSPRLTVGCTTMMGAGLYFMK